MNINQRLGILGEQRGKLLSLGSDVALNMKLRVDLIHICRCYDDV